jgi:protein-tyrosine phosphatase
MRDLSAFDYILAMDNDVLKSIWALGRGTAKVQPFIKYAPNSGLDHVPDPMHESSFEEVYSLISLGCYNLLIDICKTKSIELPDRPF